MRESQDQHVSRLVDQLSRGDPGAVPFLLERYLDDLRAYISRHAGTALQGKETPADLVQSVCREVLEGVQRGAFEYRGEAQFRQWLYQAALHKIQAKARYHDAQKREQRREHRFDDHLDSKQEVPFGTSRTPSRSAMENEEQARFLAAMAQLPPEQRQIVEWAHLEGLPHKEIARRLCISEPNSRVLLSRALARLAKIATAGPR
jgi:RNA polymerase sigma-70 factor, ECF subfamily